MRLTKQERAGVRAATKWLDETYPGWWKRGRVKLRELHMVDPSRCIVGQLSGLALDIPGRTAIYDIPWSDGIYAALANHDEEWKNIIRKRRKR